MIAIALLAAQAAEQQQSLPSGVAGIITAVFAGLALVVTALGGVWIQRTAQAAKEATRTSQETQRRLGEPNGQGDVVQMILNLEQTVTVMDKRALQHEENVAGRFEGLHRALVDQRNRHEQLAGRVDHLEGRTE